MEHAKGQVEQLSCTVEEVLRVWRELATFYGDDPDKTPPQQFFSCLHHFAMQFNATSSQQKQKSKQKPTSTHLALAKRQQSKKEQLQETPSNEMSPSAAPADTKKDCGQTSDSLNCSNLSPREEEEEVECSTTTTTMPCRTTEQ